MIKPFRQRGSFLARTMGVVHLIHSIAVAHALTADSAQLVSSQSSGVEPAPSADCTILPLQLEFPPDGLQLEPDEMPSALVSASRLQVEQLLGVGCSPPLVSFRVMATEGRQPVVQASLTSQPFPLLILKRGGS